MQKKYEISYILNHTADIDDLKEKIKKIILNNNCSIIEETDWGVKDFAYPIQKQRRGFYSAMICNTLPENISELLRIVKITKNIIRILVINTEKEKNYIQTTKLSKTEVGIDKIEHKTIGKKYRKKTFDIKIEENQNVKNEKNDKAVENKETKEYKVVENKEAITEKTINSEEVSNTTSKKDEEIKK